MSHPFGDLLSQYRARKHGLTQARLAMLAGYDPPLVTKMCQGRKELTGPSGRERVVRIMWVLHQQGVLTTLDEANALLKAAGMAPLFAGAADEAVLIRRLKVIAGDPTIPSQTVATTGTRQTHTNLPRPLTTFVGREQQVANLVTRIEAHRLLTLIGAGGVGKSRLAVEVGRSAALTPAFHDGVWLVELASLADPVQMPQTVAAVFNLPEQPERTPLDVLASFLTEARLLLILDNCEHLIGACASLAERLLSTCPDLRILATSREALNVSGEVIWRVPSLTTPDPECLPPFEHILDYEAVELFINHAAAAQPMFTLEPSKVAAIAHICHRLDGIPLAIEMAAAQVLVLSVTEIAMALDNHFGLRMIGRRTALPRHQTLHATLDWSYDLLSEAERLLLARLAVFAGGWMAEAVQVVCADSPPSPSGKKTIGMGVAHVMPLLAQLVHKSLVVATPNDDQTRFSMLETIRAYALEKLAESGDLAVIRRKHAGACLALAREARPRLNQRGQRRWIERLEREHDNMRAALAWCFGPGGDAGLGLHLLAALYPFWHKSSRHHGEECRWTAEALRVPPDVAPPAARAYALIACPGPIALMEKSCEEALHLFQTVNDQEGTALALVLIGSVFSNDKGNLAHGIALVEEGITLAREIGHKGIVVEGLLSLVVTARVLQDYDRADTLLEECYVLGQEIEDASVPIPVLQYKSDIAMCQFDFRRAVALTEQALTLARAGNEWYWEHRALLNMAVATRLMGEVRRAVDILQELLVFVHKRNDTFTITLAQQNLGRALNELGDHYRAKALLISSLQTDVRMLGEHSFTAADLDGLACVASGLGDATRAARLFGAGEAMREEGHHPLESWARLELAPYIAKARDLLGTDAFELAWFAGQQMTLEQVVAYALQDSQVEAV